MEEYLDKKNRVSEKSEEAVYVFSVSESWCGKEKQKKEKEKFLICKKFVPLNASAIDHQAFFLFPFL